MHIHLFAIEARLIWRDVNAPTYPLCLASGEKILGLALYLVAVAVLWYLVGRLIDRRRRSEAPDGQGNKTSKTIFCLLMMSWGLFLLFGSLRTFSDEIAFAQSYFVRKVIS